jgi:DMSO/TMAO reductase YedYZ molybdopterin-dependent catalytic subunit
MEGRAAGFSGGTVGRTEETIVEKPMGRRAFIGLIIAGLAALFLGKEAWSALRSTGNGPSGVFRINSVVHGPDFDRDSWRLTVDGLFRRPMSLSYAGFLDLPRVERTRDFYCVEGWGVTDVRWSGVQVSQIMKLADIDPKATHLVFYSGDGVYDDSLTIEEALRDDTLLADQVDGNLLPPDNGQPLRLVLPGSYGYKDVKWVAKVEAIAADEYSGYWEDRGYPADATIP